MLCSGEILRVRAVTAVEMMSKQESKSHTGPNQVRKEYSSWSQAIYDAVLTADDNGNLNLTVDGGSDRGEFAYFSCVNFDKVNFLSGRIEDGDTILEIQGHRVAGYTRNDVLSLLNYSARNDSAVSVRCVRAGECCGKKKKVSAARSLTR